MDDKARISTGLPALDECTDALRPGDNVVFRFDDLDQYVWAVRARVDHVLSSGEPLHYFRFASHRPLLEERSGVVTHNVSPEKGFERVITDIHSVIRKSGIGANFVFDVLSELSSTYFSDRMIGNFFSVTCPYLRRLRTIAYFGIERHVHSFHAVKPIRETTQLFVDLYRSEGETYAMPAKIEGRERRELLQMRKLTADGSHLVTDSTSIARVLHAHPWPGLPSASYRMIGIWDRTFLRAEEIARSTQDSPESAERREIFHELLTMLTGARDRMYGLLEQYFTLEDVIRIWKRMIGTGMIGGKSTGMLTATAILRSSGTKWHDLLEPHDSFFIGSDVFYSYLVENDCWWYRQLQKHPRHYLDHNDAIRDKMLSGSFPDYILQRFSDMLDYFAPAPIIVRSSSLLEDAFGNAFAGKYDSIFCVNQGSQQERLNAFVRAVQWIYSGTMSREALEYRRHRGILDRDEQMALLVQRVSGSRHGDWHLPHVAGVGFSFNPYAWNSDIDPNAGMVRLVAGLGTRAVERNDDDYTRIVALNAPAAQPASGHEERLRYSQRHIDALSLERNRIESPDAGALFESAPSLPLAVFSRVDRDTGRVIDFRYLLKHSSFVADVREMLGTLEHAYGAPVDIEFTANFRNEEEYSINVVQCRPLQVKGTGSVAGPLPKPDDNDLYIESHGGVIGHSRKIGIDRIIVVDPTTYGRLPEGKRYALARSLRPIVKRRFPEETVMLIGPGRWGTSTPALGIPVHVADISDAAVLMEVDIMHDGLVPDLSLGTHVFHEMVELDMLYVAHFSTRDRNRLRLGSLCSEHSARNPELTDPEIAECIFVVSGEQGDASIECYADTRTQTCLLYRER